MVNFLTDIFVSVIESSIFFNLRLGQLSVVGKLTVRKWYIICQQQVGQLSTIERSTVSKQINQLSVIDRSTVSYG